MNQGELDNLIIKKFYCQNIGNYTRVLKRDQNAWFVFNLKNLMKNLIETETWNIKLDRVYSSQIIKKILSAALKVRYDSCYQRSLSKSFTKIFSKYLN